MYGGGMEAHTKNHSIFLPETEIKEDRPEYVYVPLRGYGYCLAVFDINDTCIGWINCASLGYESAKEWVSKTKWIDQGY